LIEENSVMRTELEKLRKEKDEVDQASKEYQKENRTLTNLLQMEREKAKKAEDRGKKECIKAELAKRELKNV